jgi:hypothetical protein
MADLEHVLFTIERLEAKMDAWPEETKVCQEATEA